MKNKIANIASVPRMYQNATGDIESATNITIAPRTSQATLDMYGSF